MDKRYDLLDINNKLIWNFRDIGHTMRSIYEGRGSQKRILIVLLETGTISQSSLTKRLKIQPGSASEVIGKLEENGLIKRISSKTDRRTWDICLTHKGEEEAKKAVLKRKERHEKMFSCLSDGEKSSLIYLLEKINTSWEKQFGEDEQSN